MQPTPVPFTLNIDAPRRMLNIELMRKIDLVAYGLNASTASTGAAHQLLAHVLPQLHLGSRIHPTSLPEEFKTWVLACGLRDAIEIFEPFLEEMWKLCLVAHLVESEGQQVSRERLLQLEVDHATFQKLGASTKLKEILKEFPALLESDWKDSLLSIIKLRNCMVHRRGLVRQQDCNTPKGLRVCWQGLEYYFGEPKEGKGERIPPASILEREGTVTMVAYSKSKSFGLGEYVEINAAEFTAIAMTLVFAGLRIRGNFEELLLKRGHEIQAISQPAAPKASD